MKVLIKLGHLIVIPENETEGRELARWAELCGGHVFKLEPGRGSGLALSDLGPLEEACNVPISVLSSAFDPAIRLISNFAPTPFVLDGESYATVESFWQGLKFERNADRLRVAAMNGRDAKRAGGKQPYGATVSHQGRLIPVGTWQHWEVLERACWAKFTQNAHARAALLGTGERPLEHRPRRDSRTIPGVIMAEIWMKTRKRLRLEAGAIPG
jgi:hypothetical protein